MALSDKLLKEKVKEVRQLVPNFTDSNNIVLILEHYNYSVEQTVSAIVENGGADALQSWTQSSKGSLGKLRKKPVKKASDDQSPQNAHNSKDTNGVNAHGTSNGPSKANYTNKNGNHKPTQPPNIQTSKSSHTGLEKSHKELQRQITSLTHLKIVFNERAEKSYKRINEVFKELQQQLTERQAELTKQLDASKSLASNILDSYEQRSKELRTKVDRAPSMKESELAELRSEIKDFVANRRHFEEVAHSSKFDCDFNKILLDIQEFGKVHQAKSIAEHQELPGDSHSDPIEAAAPADSSKKILNQSESLLKYEAGTLTNSFNDVNHIDDKEASPVNKNPVKSSGRGKSRRYGKQGGPLQGTQTPKKPVEGK